MSNDETERTKAVLRRWYDDMWVQGNWQLVPELAGPTYTRHEFGATRVVTADEYAEQVRAVCESTTFTDLSYRLIGEGDRVCAIGQWRANGAQWTWVQAFRVADDKLVETWLSGLHTDSSWGPEATA